MFLWIAFSFVERDYTCHLLVHWYSSSIQAHIEYSNLLLTACAPIQSSCFSYFQLLKSILQLIFSDILIHFLKGSHYHFRPGCYLSAPFPIVIQQTFQLLFPPLAHFILLCQYHVIFIPYVYLFHTFSVSHVLQLHPEKNLFSLKI